MKGFLSKTLYLLNNFSLIVAGIFLVIALQGCPYSSQFCLDAIPENQVSEKYLGKWEGVLSDACDNKLPVVVEISKIDDYYYELMFLGKFFDRPAFKKHFWQFRKKPIAYPAEDTVLTNAFVSYVNSREVFNVNYEDLNFLVEIKYENDQLSLYTLGEGFSSKVMKSNKELRKSLEYHYNTRLHPMYDEVLCLENMSRIR